jgi:hypothetical protein
MNNATTDSLDKYPVARELFFVLHYSSMIINIIRFVYLSLICNASRAFGINVFPKNDCVNKSLLHSGTFIMTPEFTKN